MTLNDLVVSRRYVVTLTDGEKAEACIGPALLVEVPTLRKRTQV